MFVVGRSIFKWSWIPLILFLGEDELLKYYVLLSLGLNYGGSDPMLPEPTLFK